ncbi:MAG: hypothetical protein JKX97_01385 [Candidatus Lindowbacteria bacterium]|nr:hypothetical protein [Candidatus Lindowbacteria bacterium]
MELRRAVQFNPGNSRALEALRKLLLEEGDEEEVDRIIAKLVEHADLANTQVLRAGILLKTKQYDKALTLLIEWTNQLTIPQAGGTPSTSAQVMGNRALEHLRAIYNANHKQYDVLEAVGWLYGAQGRHQEGINVISQVFNVTKDPRLAQRLAVLQVKSQAQ